MTQKTTTPDPMTIIRAAHRTATENEELRASVKRLREEAAAAEEKLTAHSKANRDEARAQARRAQFVGEVFLALATDNPTMWTDFRPHLDAALESAAEDVRALFGLPKNPVKDDVPKTDTKEGSKAAETTGQGEATTATETEGRGKAEGEPAHPGDLHVTVG